MIASRLSPSFSTGLTCSPTRLPRESIRLTCAISFVTSRNRSRSFWSRVNLFLGKVCFDNWVLSSRQKKYLKNYQKKLPKLKCMHRITIDFYCHDKSQSGIVDDGLDWIRKKKNWRFWNQINYNLFQLNIDFNYWYAWVVVRLPLLVNSSSQVKSLKK